MAGLIEGLLNPETLKALVILFLLIWFLSGAGVRVVMGLIEKYVG